MVGRGRDPAAGLPQGLPGLCRGRLGGAGGGAAAGGAGGPRPRAFRKAYQAYVEGGWGTLAGPPEQGGQGLPLVLATVVMEDLGSANMGFSLIMMLTPAGVEALKHHGTPEQQAAGLPKLVSGE